MSDRDDTSAPAKSPKSPAERMRTYRARMNEGVELYLIPVRAKAKKGLVKIGWLTEEEAQDRQRVAAELENLIDCFGRGTLDLGKLAAAIKAREGCRKRERVRAGAIVATGTATSS